MKQTFGGTKSVSAQQYCGRSKMSITSVQGVVSGDGIVGTPQIVQSPGNLFDTEIDLIDFN